MNKKIIIIFISTLIILIGGVYIISSITEKEKMLTSNVKQKQTKQEIIPEKEKIIQKENAIIVLDSTKRQASEPFEYNPLTIKEIQEKQGKYLVELNHIPECSGTHISNSYVSLVEDISPYDHVIIHIQHVNLGANIQKIYFQLQQQDPCGYIEESPENQQKIDEMIKLYKETYKKQDIERIEILLKEIKLNK